MPTVLSRFTFPSFDVCLHTELYLRPIEAAEYSMLDGEVRLGRGGRVRFDTYFNAFGVGKWRRHTDLCNLSLVVEATGDCRLDVVYDDLVGGVRTVATRVVAAGDSGPAWLAVPALDELGTGSVYLTVSCTGTEAVIAGASWETTDEPARPVRLGLVITTFNRPAFVQANLARLATMTGSSGPRDGSGPVGAPGGDDLRIVVVDNGRNLELDLPVGAPVSVLPTPNVGGAGGFARGLMYLRDEGWATHVLFMDDDVTFDAEIVRRAQSLLAFARDQDLCISGAMLNDQDPTVVFEAGARFEATATHPLTALKGGLDLLDWRDVLAADREDEPIDYGAWWFFAFPIGLTRDNPVPMFVRGDDVCWGLLHADRKITTSNGIGLWHQDFDAKNGPLAWFYDTRNFALVSVLTCDGFRWWHLARRYLTLCGRSLLSFKYASAAEITFAMSEFLRGPGHWLAIDHAGVHEQVRALDGERLVPLTADLLAVPEATPRSGLARFAGAAGALAVLGGHVLPASWCRRPMIALHVQHRALLAAPFRTELLFRSQRRGEGFVVRRDQRRFFSLLGEMLVTAARLPFCCPRLFRAYRAAYPDMVSDEYWLRQFEPGGGSTPAREVETGRAVGRRPRRRPGARRHRSAPRP